MEKIVENLIDVSVVIPAKNEAAVIGSVVERIVSLLPQTELIVVNDGSDDETAHVAEKAGAKVVSHLYSKGNGAAIKTGARAAAGDVLVFMDGDGQHQPEDIPRLLAEIDKGHDLVVGARSTASQASIGRSIANGVYNRLASWMVGHKVDDLTSGFRAVRRVKFIQFLSLLPNGFSYPTTSTMAFFRSGYSVKYVPIEALERVGKSHISILKDGVRFFLIIFKLGSMYSPLKLFVPASALFFLLGSSYYAHTYIADGRFTNMSALLFICSILIFLMGLVSEQITALMYKDVD